MRIASARELLGADGPFAAEVSGFTPRDCQQDMAEAVEWAKRCPNPTGAESELEIRRIAESEDFGEAMTPEVREQEDRLRAKLAAQ